MIDVSFVSVFVTFSHSMNAYHGCLSSSGHSGYVIMTSLLGGLFIVVVVEYFFVLSRQRCASQGS